MSSLIHLWYSTHSLKYTLLSNWVSITPTIGSFFGSGINNCSIFFSSSGISYTISAKSLTLIAIKYGTLSCKMSISFFSNRKVVSSIILAFIISIPKSLNNSIVSIPVLYKVTIACSFAVLGAISILNFST